MPEQPLAGVTVLDLTQDIAGPFATKMLADYGADVIKIEPPGSGDPTRGRGPFFHDDPHPDKSGHFLHLNTNKRCITLDVRTAEGRKILLALARDAHVLIESFEPLVMPGLGLDYATLKKANPSLVVTSISNFGQTGPYRDMKSEEIVLYAMGGPMNSSGIPGREPLKLGGNVCQYHVGSAAALASIIALWAAETTGHGDHLDVPMFRVQAATVDRRVTMLVTYAYTGEVVRRRRAAGTLPALGVRPVADGYISMNADASRFELALKLIGREDLIDDPRFSNPTDRSQPGRGEEFDEYLLPFLLQYGKTEAFQLCQQSHIPAGPIYNMADVMVDPHFTERRIFATIEHPATGPVVYPGRPFIMTASPWAVRRPAPRLGEHNKEVLCGMLGFSPAQLAALRRTGVI